MALEGAMEEEVSGAGEGCLTQVVARVPVSRAKWPCLAPLSFPSEKSDVGTKEKALLNSLLWCQIWDLIV
ncbi:hypothetical protein D5086_033000 [Populus alba]|uniref:Uncharacterized protein n=1 Tax=Populus alba TaxID=43335 RepID=A0ACC4AFK5_POPAL